MAEAQGIDMQMISESSGVNRGLLLTFMLFEVYMLVTVAATTDRMLLVPSTVNLPLANIDIPIFGFFIIAPLFMIALHFNLLVHLQQHTVKVRAFLKQQSDSGRKQDVNLPPFMFNYLQQFQPGHLQHRLLFFVLYVMVVLFPAAVLLYAQFKFSKYHSWAMTGWHWAVLLIELYLMRLYWPQIVGQDQIEKEEETWQAVFEREKRALLLPLLQIILAALILTGLLLPVNRVLPEEFRICYGLTIQLLVFLSFALVVLLERSRLPKSGLLRGLWLLLWQTILLVPLRKGLWKVVRFLVTPFKYFLRKVSRKGFIEPEKSVDQRIGNLQGLLPILLAMAATLNFLLILALPTINRWDQSLFATEEIFKLIGPRIVVQEELLVAREPSDTIIQRYLADDKSEEKDWIKFYEGLDLRDRDLQFANLAGSRLFNVRFRNANLQGANFYRAELQGAKLGQANLQGANFNRANLQGTDFLWANLRGANFRSAELQGKNFSGANLQGTDYSFARLQGANFDRANLQGAYFSHAELQGANFSESYLLLAGFRGTNLQGANFTAAKLQGADLKEAELQGAGLRDANLQSTDMGKANLQGADLRGTFIGGTIFSEAQLILTNLQPVSCEPLKMDDWKKLRKEIARALPEKARRDDVLNRLKRASSREKTLFDAPAQVQKGGAFYDHTHACFPDWPPSRYDKQTYRTELAEDLAELACKDAYIAEALSRRADDAADIQLAKALLGKTKVCPKMQLARNGGLNRLGELVQKNQNSNVK